MSKLLAAALAAGVIWVAAQENPAATHITADDILATIANAPDDRVSDQQIRHIDAGGHNVGVGLVHRPPTTSLGAIQHHKQTEVYYVVSGRGTLVTGGELTDARPLDPEGNTVRTLTGPSTLGGIAGGQSRDIGPGDMALSANIGDTSATFGITEGGRRWKERWTQRGMEWVRPMWRG